MFEVRLITLLAIVGSCLIASAEPTQVKVDTVVKCWSVTADGGQEPHTLSAPSLTTLSGTEASMQKEKPTMANPTEKFLATMFSGGGHASQDSGLLIGSSTDGVTFRNIGGNSKPVYKPTNGVRDPIILYWQRQWYLVSSYGPSILPLLSIAKSPDLLHWTPLGSLRLSADTANNFVDVPQWIVDPSGNVHIIACVDQNHHWVELHPLSPDPAMWGDQKNWSPVTTMTDQNGEPLVQGNSFVALRNGTYYMAFNDIDASVYYLRTSAHLTSGWSAARQLNLDSSVNKGDSENLVFLSDGSLRFYISNGNSLTKVMWHADSADLGVNWTSPEVVTFEGFGPQEINWAQIVRITEPAAIAAIVAANEQTGVWTRRNENAAEQRPEPYR